MGRLGRDQARCGGRDSRGLSVASETWSLHRRLPGCRLAGRDVTNEIMAVMAGPSGLEACSPRGTKTCTACTARRRLPAFSLPSSSSPSSFPLPLVRLFPPGPALNLKLKRHLALERKRHSNAQAPAASRRAAGHGKQGSKRRTGGCAMGSQQSISYVRGCNPAGRLEGSQAATKAGPPPPRRAAVGKKKGVWQETGGLKNSSSRQLWREAHFGKGIDGRTWRVASHRQDRQKRGPGWSRQRLPISPASR